MEVRACSRLDLRPLSGFWYRALRLKHWSTRLSTQHTLTSRSRFNPAIPASYRLLYLGENHQVAMYEVGAILGLPDSPVSDPRGSWILMTLDVTLDYVADLCTPSQRKILSTTYQEMTGDWMNAQPPSPTQRLGAALFDLPGLEAVIVPSSKPGGGRNLVVFPDKLGGRSSIRFTNEINGKVESLV